MSDEKLANIHPQLRAAAAAMIPAMESMQPLTPEILPMARQMAGPLTRPEIAAPAVTRREIPGLDGDPAIPVIVVNAEAGASRPAILYLHGGGFVVGSAEADLGDLQELAGELDCTVVLVEYRLAPETPYPGAVRDAYAALQWMAQEAAQLGIDPGKLALFGRSAGAGLTAMLTHMVRARGGPSALLQVLVYPMLDDRTGSSRAMPEHLGGVLWSSERNRFGWSCFLGQEPGDETAPEGAAPARYEDLSGLPPAWIGCGGMDLFVAENLDYARRLILAGVPAEVVITPGVWHGFDLAVADAPITREFRAKYVQVLRTAFGL